MQKEEINGEKEEKKYFLQVLSTFRSYRTQSLRYIECKESSLATLPTCHRKWLGRYKHDLHQFTECIELNASFIPLVLQHAHTIFDNVYTAGGDGGGAVAASEVGTLAEGLDKVQCVFKQLMRDWSALGAGERAQCYQPIIDEVERQFPAGEHNRAGLSVLVPGAGLGRLAFEIASRGFSCQGNEFNLFMLIVSYYVLNHCKRVDEFTIYPWIHQYCNNLKAEHQMTSVKFPDVMPGPTPAGKFSMTAGDFLEVYIDGEEWDCVATCFFIDCAPNIIQFIETIYHILKPGGVWINLGPLLYHYSDVKHEKNSVEPSFDVVADIIRNVGFLMEQCETAIKTKYCQNPRSMLQYEYDSVFFVCRKPSEIDHHDLDSSVENGEVNGRHHPNFNNIETSNGMILN